MVTVTAWKKKNTENGKSFNMLVLQGDLEMVKSQKSGRYYATARSCSISCTFNDVLCEALIGKTLPGTIEKLECDPYEFTIPSTGEVVMLNYVYYYNPSDLTLEQEVFETNPIKTAA